MSVTTSALVTTATAVRLREVTFGFTASEPVIDGLSAELEPGRLCALVGPNAAGKTTLLRLMLGQLRPWQGAILLGDQSVAALSPITRAAQISYVPQRGGISFGFSVEQVVTMGRYALPQDSSAVRQALEVCDLVGLRHRVYGELSAGQQQRVLLARAIAQSRGNGQVMLLDEPGAAMDLWYAHRMMRTLVDLVRGGLAVLVVLHDLNLAARYADRVWLMHQGKLVATGSWDQVLVPQQLEPIYRMRLSPIFPAGGDRPLFWAEPLDTV